MWRVLPDHLPLVWLGTGDLCYNTIGSQLEAQVEVEYA